MVSMSRRVYEISLEEKRCAGPTSKGSALAKKVCLMRFYDSIRVALRQAGPGNGRRDKVKQRNGWRFMQRRGHALDVSLLTQDICVTDPPSVQAVIDLIPEWSSKFPDELGVQAGPVPLFEDPRVSWALERFGGAEGLSVLELGPLEGGHTYMLEQAGALGVTAIEANRRAFLKCLITKELTGLKRAQFILADFMQWFDQQQHRFDLVFCAGVLYHMMQPVTLLEHIARTTDRVYIWTHYVPDDISPTHPSMQNLARIENRQVGKRTIPHYIRSYGTAGRTARYCGGVYQTAAWLRRADILAELDRLGFGNVAIMDQVDNPHGPAMNLVASKDQPLRP
jgi:hypothetical protein